MLDRDGGWIEKDAAGIPIENPLQIYMSQMYFMTTTMTTVGYGDYNAQKNGLSTRNMEVIMLIQFFAMLSFALIKETIFSLKTNSTVQSEVAQMNVTATEFLNQIDRLGRLIHPPKDVNGEPLADWKVPTIPNQLFTEILNQIDTTMKFSADVAFASSEFYNELPPMLQQGLVNSCLTGLYTHF